MTRGHSFLTTGSRFVSLCQVLPSILARLTTPLGILGTISESPMGTKQYTPGLRDTFIRDSRL